MLDFCGYPYAARSWSFVFVRLNWSCGSTTTGMPRRHWIAGVKALAMYFHTIIASTLIQNFIINPIGHSKELHGLQSYLARQVTDFSVGNQIGSAFIKILPQFINQIRERRVTDVPG